MGMLAYCVGGGQSSSRPVDAGVYSWIAAEPNASSEPAAESHEIAAEKKAA
jgi:hypothetical protein